MSAVAGAITRASADCASEICSIAELAFGNLAIAVPQPGNDTVTGKAGERQRSDELLRRRRHRDMHIERVLLQGAYQLRCFIGSNAAGDANHDLHGSDCTPAYRLVFGGGTKHPGC